MNKTSLDRFLAQKETSWACDMLGLVFGSPKISERFWFTSSFLYRDVGATRNQQQEPSDSKKYSLKLKIRICQNSKMVKTESFYKLGPAKF